MPQVVRRACVEFGWGEAMDVGHCATLSAQARRIAQLQALYYVPRGGHPSELDSTVSRPSGHDFPYPPTRLLYFSLLSLSSSPLLLPSFPPSFRDGQRQR